MQKWRNTDKKEIFFYTIQHLSPIWMLPSKILIIYILFSLFLSFGPSCWNLFVHVFPFRWRNSVKTDLHTGKAVSRLYIANANRHDSGNYTCAIGDFAKVTVAVHVLNGLYFCYFFRYPNEFFPYFVLFLSVSAVRTSNI